MSSPSHDQRVFSPVRYQFRYLPGVVGESQRVVHQAVATDGVTVWSLCRREFGSEEIEVVERAGMPCIACVGHAATAITHQAPVLRGGDQA